MVKSSQFCDWQANHFNWAANKTEHWATIRTKIRRPTSFGR